jgi:tetratricopeptide (TPR) repeat protein
MDDIEKLKDKVEKDPSSTLFVPLAEKYRQAGQLDEAIEVLKKGIEHQPGYMSGRVALGKIYLEKDMKNEAKVEFEQVVINIPDNIFAQRKLADIYKDIGEVDPAISQYEKVLELHPADEEVESIIRELKGEGPLPDEEASQEEPVEEGAGTPVEEEVDTPVEEDAGISYEEEVGIPVEEDAGISYEEEESVPVKEEAGGLIEEEHSAGIPIGELESIEPPYTDEQAVEEDVSEKSVEELESALEEMSKPEAEEDVSLAEDDIPNLEETDKIIQEGDYIRALNIYKTHLSRDPDNTAVLQKMQELMGLMKLLGKENELLEARLESFLDKIKSHKDEFLRSS